MVESKKLPTLDQLNRIMSHDGRRPGQNIVFAKEEPTGFHTPSARKKYSALGIILTANGASFDLLKGLSLHQGLRLSAMVTGYPVTDLSLLHYLNYYTGEKSPLTLVRAMSHPEKVIGDGYYLMLGLEMVYAGYDEADWERVTAKCAGLFTHYSQRKVRSLTGEIETRARWVDRQGTFAAQVVGQQMAASYLYHATDGRVDRNIETLSQYAANELQLLAAKNYPPQLLSVLLSDEADISVITAAAEIFKSEKSLDEPRLRRFAFLLRNTRLAPDRVAEYLGIEQDKVSDAIDKLLGIWL